MMVSKGSSRNSVDVSVVIPVYNRGALVLEAIRSVLAQEHPSREVIVVDDGSTDDTVAQIEAANLDIKLIRAEHAGRSAARNHGIAAATGTHIAFLDSDDRWLPSKLSRQLALLQEAGGMAVVTGHVVMIDEVGRANKALTESRRRLAQKSVRRGFDLPALLFHPGIYPSSLLMQTEVLNEVGGFDVEMEPLEDWDLMLRLGKRFDFLAVPWPPVIEYRVHSGNTSASRIAAATIQVCDRVERGSSESHDRTTMSAIHLTRGRAMRSLGDNRGGRAEIIKAFRCAPLWVSTHGGLRLLVGSFKTSGAGRK